MDKFIRFDTIYGSEVTVNLDNIIAIQSDRKENHTVVVEGEASFRISAETYKRFLEALNETCNQ